MDQPTPDLHPTLRCTKVRVVILLALAVIGYAWMLRHYTSPFAGGSDSSGYLNSAALLRDGRLVAPVRVVPGHTAEEFGTRTHQPLGFNVREGSEVMVPTYPIGLPLHLLAFAPFVGLDWAAIPLNLVTALAGGFLFYVFGRRLGLSEALAGGGAALLLASPLYLFAAFQPLSDLLALVWSTLALLLALRAREGKFWALACGAAVAVAVLVRPTNLLLVGPVALALGLDWRRYLWVGLGGLPGALLVVGYNRQVYGSPFATGYGSIAPDFGFRYVWPNVWYFARWIPGLSSPLVVAALAAPFVSALRRREAAVLASWAVLLIAFYAFYVYAGEGWWYVRFILPAFPALLLLALVTLQAVTGAMRRPALSGAVLLLGALALTWDISQCRRLRVLGFKAEESTYAEVADWARTHLPQNATVVAMQVSGALFYYTDFVIVRWDKIEPEHVAPLLKALRAQPSPIIAVLYDFELPGAMQRLGGSWTKLAAIRNATVWRIDPAPTAP